MVTTGKEWPMTSVLIHGNRYLSQSDLLSWLRGLALESTTNPTQCELLIALANDIQKLKVK